MITRQASQRPLPATHPRHDVTEEIVESSLPPGFARKDQGNTAHTHCTTPDPSLNAQHSVDISITTLLQKEYSTDNIWRNVSKLNDIRTQRNHERVIHKRTLSEIEAFESKVEEWIQEYRDFVDDGITCKQPRFWTAKPLTPMIIKAVRGEKEAGRRIDNELHWAWKRNETQTPMFKKKAGHERT